MGFRVIVNSVMLECESFADAAALVGSIVRTPSSRPATPSMSRAPQSPAPEAIDMQTARAWQPPECLRPFVAALAENERNALGALATAGRELRLEQLAEAAGLPTTGDASAMLGHMKRAAQDHGLEWFRILSFRIAGARRQRTSFYTPGPLLKVAATETE